MKVSIKNCKTWTEDGNVYMELTYIVDTSHGSYTFTIPKLHILFKDNPEFYFTDATLSLKSIIEQASSKIGNFCRPKKLMYAKLNKEFIGYVEPDKNNNLYYLESIKNRKYKMTKEEIEKELGYMIEIVK